MAKPSIPAKNIDVAIYCISKPINPSAIIAGNVSESSQVLCGSDGKLFVFCLSLLSETDYSIK